MMTDDSGSTTKPRLVAMMPVGNEAGRYLEETLADLVRWVDAVAVLDDGSTDGTADICRAAPKVVYKRHEKSLFFGGESVLREKLWRHAMTLQPDWVVALDADERFEGRMAREIDGLIDHDEFDVVEFRLFDFWKGTTHCRVDGGWDPWTKRVRMLFRVDPDVQYSWPEQPFHCPRLPLEARKTPRVFQSDVRVMHFGWARPEDVERKHRLYKQFDDSSHLASLLDDDEDIRLEPWIEAKEIPF